MKTIAIDWSGDKSDSRARKKLWMAISDETSGITLECNRNRTEIIEFLILEKTIDSDFVVGLDFAFAFPKWYSTQNGCRTAEDLWELVAQNGERWLSECASPFWGRPGKKRILTRDSSHRETELALQELGLQPKSVFQIGGAGAVGTGSLRGMPHLLDLLRNGFNVWPFTAAALPLVVEIYPASLLCGPPQVIQR